RRPSPRLRGEGAPDAERSEAEGADEGRLTRRFAPPLRLLLAAPGVAHDRLSRSFAGRGTSHVLPAAAPRRVRAEPRRSRALDGDAGATETHLRPLDDRPRGSEGVEGRQRAPLHAAARRVRPPHRRRVRARRPPRSRYNLRRDGLSALIPVAPHPPLREFYSEPDERERFVKDLFDE